MQRAKNILIFLIFILVSQTAFGEQLPAAIKKTSQERLEFARLPYLQSATPNSILIRWRTKNATGSAVSYGTSRNKLDLVKKDHSFVTEHEMRLTNLLPDTAYFYKVGTASGRFQTQAENEVFKTPPLTGSRKPVRVWVLGDSGTGDSKARSVRDAYLKYAAKHPADLLLMLGDNAYESGKDSEYQRGLFNIYQSMLQRSVLWPSIGNHDAKSSDSASQTGAYFNIFSLPKNGDAGGAASGTEAYYSFNYGRIHFICLDSSESDLGSAGNMLAWLRKDLSQSRGSGQIDWTIVFLHHPPYSKGSNDSDKDPKSIQIRQNFLPVLEDYGVDLVLSGHSHAYERSYLLAGHYEDSSGFKESYRLSDQSPYLKNLAGNKNGTVYVVAGSSGKLSSGPMNHPAISTSQSSYGSLILDIDKNQLESKFLTDKGEIKDSFSIRKK